MSNSETAQGPQNPSLTPLQNSKSSATALAIFKTTSVQPVGSTTSSTLWKVSFFKGSPDSSLYAGIVLLSGQIADGLATPLVGIFSDKTKTRFGKRTPWYVSGCIIATFSFIFIFQKCILCDWFDNNSQAMQIFYYVFFPSAFNIGWAAVQVAHMSLVPSLTLSRKTRDQLNNQRNTFTYAANLFVLGFALLLFEFLGDAFLQFQILALGALGLGLLSSLIFLFTVNEKKLTKECQEIQALLMLRASFKPRPSDVHVDASVMEEVAGTEVESTQRRISNTGFEEEAVSWTHWFKVPAFYLYGVVYMGVRMLVNVQCSLIIFYLELILDIKGQEDNSGLPREFAIIPMIIFLSSTIVSSVLKSVYEKIGRKKTFTLGNLAAWIGATVMMFLTPDLKSYMYPLAVVIGIGQSISLNTGISLIAEVVGSKGASGAFVFGAYSLLDKFSSGIVLYLVMNIKNIKDPENQGYLRWCSCLIPALSVFVAWLFVLMGNAADYDSGDVVIDENEENKGNKSLMEQNKDIL